MHTVAYCFRHDEVQDVQVDPIRVDHLPPEVAPFRGRIGMTFAPGKYQPGGMNGHWERDLAIDVRDLAEKYGTRLLVSLVEDHELRELKIEGLVVACEAQGVRVLRRPFPDQGVPSMELAKSTVTEVLEAASRGENVVIHCKGGLGRTGLIAACALVAIGVDPERAMAVVRKARDGAIENGRQEDFVRAFAKSGFQLAAGKAIEPLDRLRIAAQELMTAHPPQWGHGHKRVIFGISTPPGSVHHGELDYSRRAERDLIGAQGFKKDPGLRNELLIVEKPLDRDGGVENNPHALTRSVSKLAQVRKRTREGAVLGPDLVAEGLNPSEERILGFGDGLSGESLHEILHLVLKWSRKGLDLLEEFSSAHGLLGKDATTEQRSAQPDLTKAQEQARPLKSGQPPLRLREHHGRVRLTRYEDGGRAWLKRKRALSPVPVSHDCELRLVPSTDALR